MPVEDLPPQAQAMYSTWWQTVTAFAGITNPDTGNFYGASDFSAVASQLRQQYPGTYPAYNPIGVSQLFGIANTIARSGVALQAADPNSPIGDNMVALPPFSRSQAEMAAMPVWQIRADVTYIDPEGTEQTGTFTVLKEQVMSSSAASLQQYVDLSVQDMLASPPGTGTPRSGTLVSAVPIQILAV